MRRSIVAATTIVAGLFLSVSATRADTLMDFSADQDYLHPSPNGGWIVDRSAPAGFEATGGELHLELAPPAPGESFYNYQGMQYALPSLSGSQALSIDMYIDSTWGDTNAGIWGVGYDDDANAISAYPILAFRKSGSVTPGIYSFDYLSPSGAWVATGASFVTDGWNTLKAVLNVGSGVDYYVNGVKVGTTVDPDTDRFSAVILNAYNFDAAQLVRYDNLAVQAVPLPNAAWGGLAMMGVLGGVVVRKRFRNAGA